MSRYGRRWAMVIPLVVIFLAGFLFLSIALAEEEEGEGDGGEQAITLSQVQEKLGLFLSLMEEGKVEEAFQALDEYLSDLKTLSQEEGALSPLEQRVAHILYVTSKHLAVLARVYQRAPEQARKGLANAITCSTKGHAHFYRAMEAGRSDEESKLSENREKERLGKVKKEKFSSPADSHANPAKEKGRHRVVPR